MRGDATRRDVLWLAGGAVLAGALAPRPAVAQEEVDDAALLGRLTRIEQRAVVVYDSALASGLLGGSARRAAALFRDQEREHVDALVAGLQGLGGSPPEPPAPGSIDGLDELQSQDDVLRFAVGVETAAVAAYYDALQRLRDPQLVKTAASIVAAEGQHLVVLRQALGRSPVPNAFETGEP